MNNRISIVKIIRSMKLHHFHVQLDRFPLSPEEQSKCSLYHQLSFLSPRRNRLGFVFYEAKIAGLYSPGSGAFYDFGGTAERETADFRSAPALARSWKYRNDKVATRMVLFHLPPRSRGFYRPRYIRRAKLSRLQ